jgi:predicted Zn-dependent protease
MGAASAFRSKIRTFESIYARLICLGTWMAAVFLIVPWSAAAEMQHFPDVSAGWGKQKKSVGAQNTSGMSGKTKKEAENDVDLIGQRSVGSGLNLYSLERERELGQKLAGRLERQVKFVSDPIVTEYVDRLGQRIVRNSDAQVAFTIKVIDSQGINTFSLPGGFLYVNSGLIMAADSEAELAGLMAHEIAHVAARHATRAESRMQIWNAVSMLMYLGGPTGAVFQAGKMGFSLTSMKFSRDAEKEADLLGMEYEYAAGYDPHAFVEFLEKAEVKEKQFHNAVFRAKKHFPKAFASYPQTEDRIARAQEEISTLFPDRKEYIVDTSEFQEVKSRLDHLADVRGTSGDGRPALRRRHASGDGKSKGGDEPTLRRPNHE